MTIDEIIESKSILPKVTVEYSVSVPQFRMLF